MERKSAITSPSHPHKLALEQLLQIEISDTKLAVCWRSINNAVRARGLPFLLTVNSETCIRIGILASRVKQTISPHMLYEGFILAVTNGYKQCVKEFLTSTKIDPSSNDNLALMTATKYDHEHIIKLLLDDRRVKLEDLSQGALDLLISRVYKHRSLIEKFISDARISDTMRYKIFLAAVCNGYTHSVRMFQDSSVDLSAGDHKALRIATESGSLSIISFILDTMVAADSKEEKVLIEILSKLIVSCGDIRAVVLYLRKLLLTAETIQLLMLVSITASRTDVVNALLRNVPDDMDINLYPAYIKAVETGQAKIVGALIDSGRVADFVNSKSLKMAVSRNFVRTVEIILARVDKEEDVIRDFQNLVKKAGNRKDKEMFHLLKDFASNHNYIQIRGDKASA